MARERSLSSFSSSSSYSSSSRRSRSSSSGSSQRSKRKRDEKGSSGKAGKANAPPRDEPMGDAAASREDRRLPPPASASQQAEPDSKPASQKLKPAASPAVAPAAPAEPLSEADQLWADTLLHKDDGTYLRHQIVALENALREVTQKMDFIEKKQARVRLDDQRVQAEIQQQQESDQKLQQRLADADEKEKERAEEALKDKDKEKEKEKAKEKPAGERRVLGQRAGIDGSRGRRMLMSVVGVLKKQKADLESDTVKQRLLMQKQLEEKTSKRNRTEQAELLQRHLAILDGRREKCAALLQEVPARIVELRQKWDQFTAEQEAMHLSCFLVTASEPPVHWLPTRHSPATRKALAKRKADALEAYTPFAASFREFMSDLRASTLLQDSLSLPGADLPHSASLPAVGSGQGGDAPPAKRQRHSSSEAKQR